MNLENIEQGIGTCLMWVVTHNTHNIYWSLNHKLNVGQFPLQIKLNKIPHTQIPQNLLPKLISKFQQNEP